DREPEPRARGGGAGGGEHRPGGPRPWGPARPAGRPVAVRRRPRVRPGPDGGPAGQRVAAERRAARVPDRLHADQVAAAGGVTEEVACPPTPGAIVVAARPSSGLPENLRRLARLVLVRFEFNRYE